MENYNNYLFIAPVLLNNFKFSRYRVNLPSLSKCPIIQIRVIGSIQSALH